MSDLLDELRRTDRQLYEIERRGETHEGPPPGWEDKFLADLDDRRMKVSPVSAACSTRYHAVHNSGRRRASDILWAVVHCEEALTAVAGAAWFANPKSKGSAQVCADAGGCYRSLGDLWVPWAAPLANLHGWHLELAGYAEWTRAQWLAHHGTLYRGAWKAQHHAGLYGIPLRWLTDKQLASRKVKGFTSHRQITRVFGHGTHTDPGPHFPYDVFMRDVRAFAGT